VRAGGAVVAQLLLRLDDPQQPVDDVVVQPAAGGRGRLLRLGRRRLCVWPQVPGVPRPAVPYGRALSGATGGRALQQHQRRGHQHGCARGRHGVCSVDAVRRYRGRGDGDQSIGHRCRPLAAVRSNTCGESHEKSHHNGAHVILLFYIGRCASKGPERRFHRFVGKSNA